MTTSHYTCLRCQAQVTEQHDGPRVRPEHQVLCLPCCRKALNEAFDFEPSENIFGAVKISLGGTSEREKRKSSAT